MTDEEKIDIPKDVYLRNIFCRDCSLKKTCGNDPCENYEYWKEGYEKGLAAGKPQWHDLRENPEDLPTETGHYSTDDGEYIYDTDYKKWRTLTCMACWDSSWLDDGDVIAWCELPKFEEK